MNASPKPQARARISKRKTIERPPITLVYGEPGIGKTTFAANAPDVVFVCVEQGTNNLQVMRARVEDANYEEGERDPVTFDEVLLVLDSLIAAVVAGNTEFKNVCIDTLDALEGFIHQHICRLTNKKSIGEFNFGKGYDLTVDAFRLAFQRFERLKELGIGVILTAHAKIESFNNPEGQNFDFFDIKIHKKVSGLLVERSDNVLFARREQFALEENGKVRGVTSGARFLHTVKTPAYIAKNRYSLPDRLPLRWFDYQTAMDQRKPADPQELRASALELIHTFDKETQKEATAALAKIAEDDAPTLVQFLDYVRSKVSINTK